MGAILPGLDCWFRRFFPGLAPESCLVLTDDGFRLLAANGTTYGVVTSEIAQITVFRRFTMGPDIDIFDVWTTGADGDFTTTFDDSTRGWPEVTRKLVADLPNFLADWFTVLNGMPSETPVVIFERNRSVDQG